MQVLSILVRYVVESNDESMAMLGVSLLQQLMQSVAATVDAQGWDCIVDAFQQGCNFSSLESLLSDRYKLSRASLANYIGNHLML